MFEEARNEKIEDLRKSYQLAEVSVEHINKEKLKRVDNLITFTKYICQDLRSMPLVLSRFIIYSAKKMTGYDLSKFPSAAFHQIQKIQEGIISEEPERKRLLSDINKILDGKDSVIFEDAEKTASEMMDSFLEGYEKRSLEINLMPWYKALHKSVTTLIDAAYRKPERDIYLKYALPLMENLKHALKILEKIDSLIKEEEQDIRTTIERIRKIKTEVHKNKFAFAR